jgi:hypothetical protein
MGSPTALARAARGRAGGIGGRPERVRVLLAREVDARGGAGALPPRARLAGSLRSILHGEIATPCGWQAIMTVADPRPLVFSSAADCTFAARRARRRCCRARHWSLAARTATELAWRGQSRAVDPSRRRFGFLLAILHTKLRTRRRLSGSTSDG